MTPPAPVFLLNSGNRDFALALQLSGVSVSTVACPDASVVTR